jgi:hypothetical protein
MTWSTSKTRTCTGRGSSRLSRLCINGSLTAGAPTGILVPAAGRNGG